LRPALVFGDGDRGNMIALIKRILGGKYFIVGDGSALKSLIYSRDLAEAISLVVKQRLNGFSVFNIANVEPVTVKKLSETVLLASGKKTELRSLPPFIAKAAAIGLRALFGASSPLTLDQLAKLTRNNSVSVAAFVRQFNFKASHNLR